ncbi:SseB family protein [Streptococcus saliviloxodontae]|uniref:Antibiotic biosynthesis monooxygenase (ABM) superfamily enzyme n=1 Tax=Streptococcus saliviloxodontae TaxID=1349416 RepID=A0ABS2PL02_9STRE|nr:SseB family protein [Streptococcus saliviloxodontae]MBM7635952.1 antibiotic biosynthesis monooxygenase (ABM) superfamily enzyme [Streptococcus saliviloxodontae]
MVTTFNSEFDMRLRHFIAEPDNFLESMALVNAIHTHTVYASDQAYAIALEGQKVTPVFTSMDDLDNFRHQHPSAKSQSWVQRTLLQVLEEVIAHNLNGIVFNIKKSGDFANSTIFKSSELIQFINTYTTILNTILSEDNKATDLLQKTYLVPVFIHPNEDGSYDRLFPTMSNQDERSYVPVFTDLVSFGKWYNNSDFGLPFRQAQGAILTWTAQEIYRPGSGQSGIDETVGLVVNPFDEDQALIEWTQLEG